MKSLLVKEEKSYDGSQLRSLFAYFDHGVQGDSIVSFIGPCNVATEHMVDGEDLLNGDTIAGAQMVHFIIEKFSTSLIAAVALQRLFASICLEILRLHVGDKNKAAQFRRSGDDLYWGEGKLSISIATVSPVSALIHFAVNVTNAGTPVKTASLQDVDFPALDFAREVLQAFVSEMTSIEEATTKVRWVK